MKALHLGGAFEGCTMAVRGEDGRVTSHFKPSTVRGAGRLMATQAAVAMG